MRLSKQELCGSLVVPKGAKTASGTCSIKPSALAFLKTLANSFERIKWLAVQVVYKPAVGTVRDGVVTIGADWNWSDPKTTRQDIAAYTPTQSGSVFKEFRITLPQDRLQSRLWYSTAGTGMDSGPAQICWAVDAYSKDADLTVGELWVNYTVHLDGTTA